MPIQVAPHFAYDGGLALVGKLAPQLAVEQRALRGDGEEHGRARGLDIAVNPTLRGDRDGDQGETVGHAIHRWAHTYMLPGLDTQPRMRGRKDSSLTACLTYEYYADRRQMVCGHMIGLSQRQPAGVT